VAGQVAIHDVGDGRRQEDRESRAVPTFQDRDDEKRQRDEPQERQEVRQVRAWESAGGAQRGSPRGGPDSSASTFT
jgi:hypothetical protein